MKRALSVLLAVAWMSLNAQASVLEGSKHNFTDESGNDGWYTGSESCSPCHFPDVKEEEQVSPAWDAEYADKVLPVVNTEIMDGSSDSMSTITRICVSCHDGTIAHEVLDDVTKSYHVGRWYDRGVAVRSNDRLVSPSMISLPLFDGRVDCPTCHDPHSGHEKLLRIENDEDEDLCRTCHNL